MLYAKPKQEALDIHKRAVEKYNRAFEQMKRLGEGLYEKRRNSITLIQEIESLVNSIANRPKEFEKSITEIRAEREKFHETELYMQEAVKAAVGAGGGVVAGAAAGAAVAAMAPSAAMWVATTFGTASTGTAISALHGAVATKAALAWLGGGALSAGGAGVAGGQALLALAGPIGWGIAGASTAVSAIALSESNRKIANEAIAEARRITIAGAEVKESSAKIRQLSDQTAMLLEALRAAADENRALNGANYPDLSEDEQYRLGVMVNNPLALAALLNKTV